MNRRRGSVGVECVVLLGDLGYRLRRLRFPTGRFCLTSGFEDGLQATAEQDSTISSEGQARRGTFWESVNLWDMRRA